MLNRGPIPDGLCVLHTCDNPPCTNPAHLFLGTSGDNCKDRAAKGRSYSKLNLSQVRQIRSRRAKGEVLASIAKDFPVSSGHIGRITNGADWAWSE